MIVRCSNSMPESEKRNRRRELKALQRKREEELARIKTLKENSTKCIMCRKTGDDEAMLKCSQCKIVSCHISCVVMTTDTTWVCKACVIRLRRVEKEKEKKSERKKRKKKEHVYCKVEEFHMDCVGLKTRRRNWYCKECLDMYPEFLEEEKLKVGLLVTVYWPLEKKWFKGKVHELSHDSASVEIHYNDGDVQIHPLQDLRWRRLDNDCAMRKKRRRRK